MEAKKSGKKIIIDVPDELHSEVKIRAIKRNVSMKVWILQAIFEKIGQEKLYEA